MRQKMMLVQAACSAGGAWLSAKLGLLFPVMLVLVFLMAVDYLTGMGASKVEALDHPGDSDYGWNSKKGLKGILKKVGYLCVIAVAMAVDYVVLVVAAEAGLTVSAKVMFGLLVAIWYIFNELLSIVENAGRMGSPVPEWLVRYIAVLKTEVGQETEERK